MRTQVHPHLPVYLKNQADFPSILHYVCWMILLLTNSRFPPEQVLPDYSCDTTGRHRLDCSILCTVSFDFHAIFSTNQALLFWGLFWRWRITMSTSGKQILMEKMFHLSVCFSFFSFPVKSVLLIVSSLVKSLLPVCSERQEFGVANPLRKEDQLYKQ